MEPKAHENNVININFEIEINHKIKHLLTNKVHTYIAEVIILRNKTESSRSSMEQTYV